MCKASSDTVQWKVKGQLTYPNKTEISLPANTVSYTDYELSFKNSWSSTFTFDIHIDEWQWYSANYYQTWWRYTEFCYSNWVTTEVITSWWDTKTNVEKKWITLSPWNTLNFIWRRTYNHVSSYDWYMWYRIWTTLSYEWYIDINKPTDYKEIKIYDVVWLWTEVSSYILGILPDNSRWDWGLWWLPAKFVEKVVVTTTSDTAVLPNTYDYYTFVIAEFRNPSNEITSSVLKWKWASSWSDWQPDGSWLYKVMNSSFFSPNSLIELVKSWWSWTYTANFWIYKLNLP